MTLDKQATQDRTGHRLTQSALYIVVLTCLSAPAYSDYDFSAPSAQINPNTTTYHDTPTDAERRRLHSFGNDSERDVDVNAQQQEKDAEKLLNDQQERERKEAEASQRAYNLAHKPPLVANNAPQVNQTHYIASATLGQPVESELHQNMKNICILLFIAALLYWWWSGSFSAMLTRRPTTRENVMMNKRVSDVGSAPYSPTAAAIPNAAAAAAVAMAARNTVQPTPALATAGAGYAATSPEPTFDFSEDGLLHTPVTTAPAAAALSTPPIRSAATALPDEQIYPIPKSSLNQVQAPINDEQRAWVAAMNTAGQLAAYSLYIMHGGDLIPTLQYPTAEKMMYLSLVGIDPNDAIKRLVANADGHPWQALAFDSYATLATGRVDAVTIHAHSYVEGIANWTITIPYSPVSSTPGFYFNTPLLVQSSLPPEHNALLMHAFYEGIEHMQLNNFWNTYLRE
jgi:hypothetical protein